MTVDISTGYFAFLAKLRSINTLPYPNITTDALAETRICGGESLEIPFTATGSFNANNLFYAELSDAKGSFLEPFYLEAGKEGPIKAIIPNYIPLGDGYRIRVRSSSPYIAGSNNNNNLDIVGALPNFNISGPSLPCSEETVLKYSILPITGAVSYNWNIPIGWEIQEGQSTTEVIVKAKTKSGKITVTATNDCGASSISAVDITLFTPAAPNVTMGSNCNDNLQWFTATGATSGYHYRWYTTETGGTPLSYEQTYQISKNNLLPV